MGFDVTYHPMTAAEMEEWFFGRLPEVRSDDFARVAEASLAAELDEGEREGYAKVLAQAAAWDNPSASFEPSYGFALAAVQTFFGPFWYTRGSSFTALAQQSPRFDCYLSPLPASEVPHFPPNPSDPRIAANWQSGAWVPPESVRALLADFEADPQLASELRDGFPGGQHEVILDALRSAAGAGRGVLEATDVVEPDPLDLSKSSSVGSLRNVDLQGLLLYRKAALAQLEDAGLLK